MSFSVEWQPAWTAALMRHLWQSTLVCLVAWLLTLALKQNHSRIRFRLWMVASIKFLVPFALLTAAGEHVRTPAKAQALTPLFSVAVEGASFTQPAAIVSLGSKPAPLATQAARASHLPWLLVFVWASGTLTILYSWAREWWAIRRIARSGSLLGSLAGIPLIGIEGTMEPGVFGVVRPVLLLPQNLSARLTPAQSDAVLAHELCHVRRRDNLTAALHTLVTALFWFHPLVWWIRHSLVQEREIACDEAVLASNNSALNYAEGILRVCRLYLESPVATVAGVTGADLKLRIARILSPVIVRQLGPGRKLLLVLAALGILAAPILSGSLRTVTAHAQAEKAGPGIEDTWQGTLHADHDLRTMIKISKGPDGVLHSQFYSIDQGGRPTPIKTTTLQNGQLSLDVEDVGGVYTGKISSDGNTITGEWKQGDKPLPLVLVRATTETAWAIPEPPKPVLPMAKDAKPNWDVATIKPASPDGRGQGSGGPPGHFSTFNTTLNDLISFAYDVNAKQITSGPAWMETDKFDIMTGSPDQPGEPNMKQLKAMLRTLLEQRFAIKYHSGKKDMPAYVLTVAKGGQKLTNNTAGDHLEGAFYFPGKLGNLVFRDTTMDDFCHGLQSAVFDRPVVNHTSLEGYWDGGLKWTPDESQFTVINAKIVPDDSPDAPPPFFTAIQEQIGLKLDAEKTAVDVMILDHVEKPSEN